MTRCALHDYYLHAYSWNGKLGQSITGGFLRFEVVDRKSTRLNSSHANSSYAVFRLKKKILMLASHPETEPARDVVVSRAHARPLARLGELLLERERQLFPLTGADTIAGAHVAEEPA